MSNYDTLNLAMMLRGPIFNFEISEEGEPIIAYYKHSLEEAKASFGIDVKQQGENNDSANI